MHQDFAGLRKRGAVIVVQCEAGSPLRPKRAALRAAQGFAPSLPRTGNLKHPWGILIVADEKERLTPNRRDSNFEQAERIDAGGKGNRIPVRANAVPPVAWRNRIVLADKCSRVRIGGGAKCEQHSRQTLF